MRGRLGQEEMVGFVLIVVIVVVIAIVLLGISLRNRTTTESILESQEVSSFLGSVKGVTSSCEFGSRKQNIGEIVKRCYNNQECDDERQACEVLKLELEELLGESGYVVSKSSPNAYYKMDVYIGESVELGSGLIEAISEDSLDGGSCNGIRIWNFETFQARKQLPRRHWLPCPDHKAVCCPKTNQYPQVWWACWRPH